MVTVVFILGILNLALGFGLAVWLNGSLVLLLPSRAKATVPDADDPEESVAGEAEPAVAEDGSGIPVEWRETLQQHGIETSCIDEALLWMIRLELPAFRDQLTAYDEAFREDNVFPAPPESIVTWTEQTEEWARLLSKHEADPLAAVDRPEVEDALLDHAHQLQSARDLLQAAVKNRVREEGIRQSCCLVAACDHLLDRIDELLVGLLVRTGAIARLPEQFHKVTGVNAYTRLGLGFLFHQWVEDDAERLRLVSGVIVDVDRVGKLNQDHGTLAVDGVLAALLAELRTLIREARGFDRLAHIGSSRFFIFLGDTSGENAAKATERFRQTIEATAFRAAETSIDLTISNACGEFGADESVSDFLIRLKQGVAEAKKLGRNRTCLDSGNGPELQSLQYQVTGQVLEAS